VLLYFYLRGGPFDNWGGGMEDFAKKKSDRPKMKKKKFLPARGKEKKNIPGTEVGKKK
jgi:hypothetical protein